jgi:hypothetical protein
MTQRPISTLATLFGVLALIGVFLPWHSTMATNERGASELVDCIRGFEGVFLGEWVLVVGGLGTAALVWFALKKTNPGLSRALLLGATLFFAASVSLSIADLGREIATSKMSAGGRVFEEGRGVGIYVTLVGSIVALLLTLATFLSPKTIYEDEDEDE